LAPTSGALPPASSAQADARITTNTFDSNGDIMLVAAQVGAQGIFPAGSAGSQQTSTAPPTLSLATPRTAPRVFLDLIQTVSSGTATATTIENHTATMSDPSLLFTGIRDRADIPMYGNVKSFVSSAYQIVNNGAARHVYPARCSERLCSRHEA